MTINDKIRDEKLQYDIKRKVAKISALSSGKINNIISYRRKNITLSKKSDRTSYV